MKRAIILVITLSIVATTNAQDVEGLRKLIGDMIEQLAEQQQMDVDYEEMVNDLINLSQNPIDLNNTTKEELETLFFLSDFQIENILFYQYNNGPIMGIYELQAVEDLVDSVGLHAAPRRGWQLPRRRSTRHRPSARRRWRHDP